MAKGIVRKVIRARRNVEKEIQRSTDDESMFDRGLSFEGYNGGYINALDDVLLALNGVTPRRYSWWKRTDLKEGV